MGLFVYQCKSSKFSNTSFASKIFLSTFHSCKGIITNAIFLIFAVIPVSHLHSWTQQCSCLCTCSHISFSTPYESKSLMFSTTRFASKIFLFTFFLSLKAIITKAIFLILNVIPVSHPHSWRQQCSCLCTCLASDHRCASHTGPQWNHCNVHTRSNDVACTVAIFCLTCLVEAAKNKIKFS